jgi:hypothetical protein
VPSRGMDVEVACGHARIVAAARDARATAARRCGDDYVCDMVPPTAKLSRFANRHMS